MPKNDIVEEMDSERKIPSVFLCPLTRKLMLDPVVDTFGVTYERAAITKWQTEFNYSPAGEIYPNLNLVPNFALKSLIDKFINNDNLPLEDVITTISQIQLQTNLLNDKFQQLRSQLIKPLKDNIASNNEQTTTSIYFPFWLKKNEALSLDKQIILQNQLIQACYEGNVTKIERLLVDGANCQQANSADTLPLAAAIWGLNLKAIKKIIKILKPDPDYIKNCLIYNKEKFGTSIPVFKPIAELDLHDLFSEYFKTGGRQVIFSDWIINSIGLNAGCIKEISDKEFIITTKAMGTIQLKPSKRKLIELGQSEGAKSSDMRLVNIYQTILSQYLHCTEAIHNLNQYLKIFTKSSDLIEENELMPAVIIDKEPISEKMRAEQLLKHVVRGEQEEAEQLLKKYPKLAIVAVDVEDCSGRKFTRITAFQYALWALDWHMWQMLLNYLSPDEAKRQEAEQEIVTKASGYGTSFDFSDLINALQIYVDNMENWSNMGQQALIEQQWKGLVGHAQKMVPAHVANEYCHPHRSFRPTPSFKEPDLPRVLKKKDWNGDWWSAVYAGFHLGEDITGKGWAIHRGWAEGGPGPWEGGPPTGCITLRTAQTDLMAMTTLSLVRRQQLLELRVQLSKNESFQNKSFRYI